MKKSLKPLCPMIRVVAMKMLYFVVQIVQALLSRFYETKKGILW